jgi:hypothetical protein
MTTSETGRGANKKVKYAEPTRDQQLSQHEGEARGANTKARHAEPTRRRGTRSQHEGEARGANTKARHAEPTRRRFIRKPMRCDLVDVWDGVRADDSPVGLERVSA